VKVPDASWDDMNEVLRFPSGHHSGDPDDDAWEALLADGLLPDDADETARAVSEVLAILAGALPGPGELRGEARAMTAFRETVGKSNPSRPRHRRPSVLTPLLAAKPGVAVAAGVLVVGGFAAAAYSGSLPAVAQNFAHALLGAPEANGQGHPGHGTAPSTAPVGTDATANAAFGLCTTYEQSQLHGSATYQALALSNLATAAGGASNTAAYCANVPRPRGTSSSNPSALPTGEPSSLPSYPSGEPSSLPSYPSGEPSSLPSYPSGEPSSLPSHPSGPPSSHPSGPPSSLPSHPTGEPTS
jgi:hypothetical protein